MTDPAQSSLNDNTGGGGQASVLHASCVALDKSGVLILGASGAGKSSLALQLMALGADLVSDDRTCVSREGDGLLASAPATIKGLIEARGVGVLVAAPCPVAHIRLVIDLDQIEPDRLPPMRSYILLGQTLPLLHNVKAAHFAAAILQYLKGGRNA